MKREISFLNNIQNELKGSNKFSDEEINKNIDIIKNKLDITDNLLQLHWSITQIISESNIENIAILILNAFYDIVKPDATALFLLEDGKIIELSQLNKNCPNCEGECSKMKQILRNTFDNNSVSGCKFKGIKHFTLYKRDGKPLGYLTAYYKNPLVRNFSNDIFIEVFIIQIGLALEIILLNEKMKKLAYTDELTNLANKRVLLKRIEEESERVYSLLSEGKETKGFGVILLDVDNFKHYNDNYGHLAGDEVLRHLGKIINDNIRKIDLGARYGGEELSIILPETTLDESLKVAEIIRKEIESTVFEYREVTVSIGVSHYPTHITEFKEEQDILNLSDIALYRAKKLGKNRVYKFVSTDL